MKTPSQTSQASYEIEHRRTTGKITACIIADRNLGRLQVILEP